MDSWNDKQVSPSFPIPAIAATLTCTVHLRHAHFQIQKMRVGGNDQCNQFLQKYGVHKTMPIPQKYNTPAAMLYKDRIDAAANGRPLPTELPGGGAMGGGGSTHSSNSSLHSS